MIATRSPLESLLRLAATLLLLALLASVVIGVIARLLGHPVSWSDEAAQYLLVWTGFVGWMLASRKRAHIRITLLLDALPRKARIAAAVAIELLVIGFAAALIRYATPLIVRNWDIEWVSLPLPSGLLYLPVPFAATVLIAEAIIAIRAALRGDRAPDPVLRASPE